jgi:hypothetical protein
VKELKENSKRASVKHANNHIKTSYVDIDISFISVTSVSKFFSTAERQNMRYCLITAEDDIYDLCQYQDST